jgi:hypothetical protein
MAELSIAGGIREYGAKGFFWAGIPRESWEIDTDSLNTLEEIWDPKYGDRMTNLVFIGEPKALNKIHSLLHKALVTEREEEQMEQLKEEDPFEDWETLFPNR